jgi:hypothetical protein
VTALSGAVLAVPVQPDGDQGRQWLLDELGKPVYQAAKPTWFDLASQAVSKWFSDLLQNASEGQGAVAFAIVLLVLAGLIVTAFLVFGRPRLGRRSRIAPGALFGDEDGRGARELRQSAERAAAAGDYTTATLEMFRAVARGLAERTVVDVYPGMTARGFAREATVALPALTAALGEGAADFDLVRYLGGAGSSAGFERMAALERGARDARPTEFVAP